MICIQLWQKIFSFLVLCKWILFFSCCYFLKLTLHYVTLYKVLHYKSRPADDILISPLKIPIYTSPIHLSDLPAHLLPSPCSYINYHIIFLSSGRRLPLSIVVTDMMAEVAYMPGCGASQAAQAEMLSL